MKSRTKLCFRFNLRSIIGSFMALAGTWQIVFTPLVTGIGDRMTVWGWGAVPIAVGAALLAAGEFCEKDDC